MQKLKWNGYGRHLAMGVYVSSAIFIASHIVNAFVANELTAPPIGPSDFLSNLRPLESSLEQGSSTSTLPQPPQQQVQAIVASGIFALPQATGPGTGPGQHAAASPLDLAKKVSLLGTALGNSRGMAIFEVLETKEQKLVSLHDSLLNIGELAAIEKDRVLLRSGNQEEWIISSGASAMANSPRFPLSSISVSSKPEVSSQTVAGQVPARRLLKRQDLKNRLPYGSREHVRTYFEGGKKGVGVQIIPDPEGLFIWLGLEEDDILYRVNGVEILNRVVLLDVLRRLALERRISLDFARNGERRTLSYVVE